MRGAQTLASVLVQGGAPRLLDAYWGPDRLTVLAYHRVVDSRAPGFALHPTGATSPALFARQMAYVAEHFHVIDLATLEAFVRGERALPPRPLLITFDDGYADNYTQAYPVLLKYGLPAVIFLITNHIDHPARLPWWDQCAYCFYHTAKTQAELPWLGHREFPGAAEKIAARDAFIRCLKAAPEDQKQAALGRLMEALEVDAVPPGDPLFMTWEQVRELVDARIACEAHTATHPILTRVPPEEMRREIEESRNRIVQETGRDVRAFAYPNGMPGDYDRGVLRALRETGFTMAFTLAPGPLRADAARRHPLELSRVCLSYKDTFETFVLRVMGLKALVTRPQWVEA